LTACSPIWYYAPANWQGWNGGEIEGDTIRKGKEAMKMRREHLCPIPTQAQAILESLCPLTGHTAHVFYNATTGRPITTAAAFTMKRHGINTTSHGWRHAFSTLMNGRGYDRDHIEKQLSHTEKTASATSTTMPTISTSGGRCCKRGRTGSTN